MKKVPVKSIGTLFMLLSWVAGPIVAGQTLSNQADPRSGIQWSAAGPADVSSEALALEFLEIAEELAATPRATEASLEQAMVLLIAARWLDYTGDPLQRLLLDLASHWPQRDYSPYVREWLERHYRQTSDQDLLQRSLDYLLGQMKFRNQQEQLLKSLAQGGQGKNPRFDSELKTQLGMVSLEQSDRAGALAHFRAAYAADKNNKVAFGQWAALDPNAIAPELYFEHLRYVLRSNPLDLDAALTFAQYAERLEIYSIAAGSYQYCVQLHEFLHPADAVPAHIYLPWAMSCFNTQQKHAQVLEIAESVRRRGTFDIFLEAAAGRAALALRDPHTASIIFSKVNRRAQELLNDGPATAAIPERQQSIGPKQLAWFYCFADPEQGMALDWANRAYAVEPDSLAAASLLSFALVMNDQIQWARPLAEGNPSQIGLLALARIFLSVNDVEGAKQALLASIAKDPGSLAAVHAKELLKEHGFRYTPTIDSGSILTLLADQFGEYIVPQFVDPAHRLSLRLDLPRGTVRFGEPINGTVTATNHSSEPLLIQDQGLFPGIVRIDAQVSGDVTLSLPGLITKRVFSDVLVPPGEGVAATVRLDVPHLRRTLSANAQASLEIDFSIRWHRGVRADADGSAGVLSGPRPLPVTVRRPGVKISSRSIDDLYNSIPTADAQTRIETAKLFIGLLKEQELMYREQQMNRDVLYRFKYADWMPAKLRSALTSDSGLLLHDSDEQWEAVAIILNHLSGLTLPTDLVQTITTHLNSPRWPLRLSSLVLLAQDPRHDIRAVLQWTAQHDEHVLMRDMARALMIPSFAP